MTEHEDLCPVGMGGEVCACDEIRQARAAANPWVDVMVTVQMDHDERAHEREHTLAAARVEAESLGHSQDCARWIWANRDLPCDCGLESGVVQGELA